MPLTFQWQTCTNDALMAWDLGTPRRMLGSDLTCVCGCTAEDVLENMPDEGEAQQVLLVALSMEAVRQVLHVSR